MGGLHPAYVAGLVDGEGSIGFTRIRHRHYPRVFITSTNRELLEAVQSRFGGDITQAVRVNVKWKAAFHWRISNNAAVRFLEKIYPWLLLKERQAALVFLWAAMAPGKGGKWSAGGLEAVELLNEQRKWLNHKGTSPRPEEPMKRQLREYATKNKSAA